MFGREFELLDRRLAWAEDRVYFHDEAGAVIRMPAGWTSVGDVDPFVALSAVDPTFELRIFCSWQTLWNGWPKERHRHAQEEEEEKCEGNNAVNVRRIMPQATVREPQMSSIMVQFTYISATTGHGIA